MKRLAFIGSSRADLKDFPETARRKAGFQLDRVQRGLEPEDWKPMTTIGHGVREIRVKEVSGAFRVVYVAAFAEAVFVLHAFQKKTPRTPARELELATARFKELARSMMQ
jgi:phage-related protein